MLNEERVKHMVKLALYESGSGAEELKASSYFKKDYINFNMWCTIMWITVAYMFFVLLLGITYMQTLVESMSISKISLILIALILVYLAILVIYIILARKLYRKKHAKAYHRVKKFKQDLAELETLYRKEDFNE